MADEPENVPAEETKPEPEPKADDRTARSDDDPVDWVAEARKWEKQAKANSDAAARLKELEDAEKTEQQKLTENLTAAETRAADAELRSMRLEVASDKGLTKAQAKYLTGTTSEELEAAADELLELFAKDDTPAGPARRPQERLKPGSGALSDPDANPDEIADRILSRNRI